MELPLAEFRRLDLNSEELGVPVAKLMANAGKALAEAIRPHVKEGHVVLLCGKGNNGGDGFAAAGVLQRWGVPFAVVLLEPITKSLPKRFLELLPADSVKTWGRNRRAWEQADVVVDCMFGSGIRNKPRMPYDQAVRWLNKQPGHKLSCDVPSGFLTSESAAPDATLTFHAKKAGMTRDNSGKITIADIGIPPDAGRVGLGDLDAGYVRPAPDSHKGNNGRVLVIGGGPFTGAPYYAGMGAVRAGADLVHVATTETAGAVIESWGPDLLIHTQPGEHISRLPNFDHVDAVVVGPGLGTHEESLAVVQAVLAQFRGPVVVDADGLAALDKATLETARGRLVVTPHGAESKRLFRGKADAFAKKHGLVVLNKGATDTITDGERTRRCLRGHPAMTVGGTGDVLAGVVGCLLAKGASPFDAACAAAYMVGVAGEVAASLRGYGMTASDLIEALPVALLRLEQTNT